MFYYSIQIKLLHFLLILVTYMDTCYSYTSIFIADGYYKTMSVDYNSVTLVAGIYVDV